MFQSAGRIIGWLKRSGVEECAASEPVSIRRADYWLVEGIVLDPLLRGAGGFQSAGRIIGWLKPSGFFHCLSCQL